MKKFHWPSNCILHNSSSGKIFKTSQWNLSAYKQMDEASKYLQESWFFILKASWQWATVCKWNAKQDHCPGDDKVCLQYVLCSVFGWLLLLPINWFPWSTKIYSGTPVKQCSCNSLIANSLKFYTCWLSPCIINNCQDQLASVYQYGLHRTNQILVNPMLERCSQVELV